MNKDSDLGKIAFWSGVIGMFIVPVIFSSIALFLGIYAYGLKQMYSKAAIWFGSIGLGLLVLSAILIEYGVL